MSVLLPPGRSDSVDRSARWRRVAPHLGTVGGLAVATSALHLRDPHVPGSWGLCPSAATLGIACPGCGGLRAVHDLTHLDLVAAASSNLLLVLAIPLVVFLLARRVLDAYHDVRRPPTWLSSGPALWAGGALLAAFVVARNLPAGAWLAP